MLYIAAIFQAINTKFLDMEFIFRYGINLIFIYAIYYSRNLSLNAVDVLKF